MEKNESRRIDEEELNEVNGGQNYINHNLNSLTALNNMNRHAKNLSAELTKVTTGVKLNHSKDDPDSSAIAARLEEVKKQYQSMSGDEE